MSSTPVETPACVPAEASKEVKYIPIEFLEFATNTLQTATLIIDPQYCITAQLSKAARTITASVTGDTLGNGAVRYAADGSVRSLFRLAMFISDGADNQYSTAYHGTCYAFGMKSYATQYATELIKLAEDIDRALEPSTGEPGVSQEHRVVALTCETLVDISNPIGRGS